MFDLTIGKGRIQLSDQGDVVGLVGCGEKNISDPQHVAAPFIQVGVEGQVKRPYQLTREEAVYCFKYEGNLEVKVKYEDKGNYSTFEIVDVSGICDSVMFGPIFTNVVGTVGEIIGLVRDEVQALGIQALNIKTMPGFPHWHSEHVYEGCETDKKMSQISVENANYYASAAFGTSEHSLVQLYSENKSVPRVKTVRRVENVPVPAMANGDEHITGAKFALYVCQPEDALETIGQIEVAEGLPHPMINGEWAKTSRAAMASYLITEFTEETIEGILELTKKAGFTRLYHSEPFSTWGHFDLRPDLFPDGDASLVRCTQKAAEHGIGIGLHTLTNFTKTNDAYVTPVPHDGLMKMGYGKLTKAVDAEATRIYVTSKTLFDHVTNLKSVQIEKELIIYAEVGEDEEGTYLDGCRRGAYQTAASSHQVNTEAGLLFDHGYRIFFPDIHLQDAYSDRLIELFNKANIIQVSFDGLEGCRFVGEDEYGVSRFVTRCYEGWNHDVINDASQLTHNLWHISTYMNWGEPWGEKMRQGMTAYRIKNQEFYKKNLFPRMFGWLLIKDADKKQEASTLQDIEWALSEAAGYDAGFAFVMWPRAIQKLGNLNEIFETVKHWEKLRMDNCFIEEVREKLRDVNTEWHLEPSATEENKYLLYPLDMSQTFTCDLAELQPGQPGGADWVCMNPYDVQGYHCRIRVQGDGWIENLALTTKDGMVKFDGKVKGGQYLIYKGGKEAYVTDKNYNKLKDIKVIGESRIESGQQTLSMTCEFDGDEEPEVTVNMLMYGDPIEIDGK